MFGAVADYLRMIKFSHSVFALPFALTAALMAASGLPDGRTLFWVVVAMVGARSGAMGLNRVIDRGIDAKNPRTSGREIPSGKISAATALAFSVISLGIMVLAAYMLNPLCLQLSPLAIAVLVLYSFTKRFTWAAHVVLGIAISAGPLGAWMAVRGTIGPEILPLTLAVVFWLAGVDILYALSDLEFDRRHGLFSIPARFGIARSLIISRVMHIAAYALLVYTGAVFGLHWPYYLGLGVVGGLFIYEHSLVRADDLGRLDMAFFNMNGYISISVFVFTALEYGLFR